MRKQLYALGVAALCVLSIIVPLFAGYCIDCDSAPTSCGDGCHQGKADLWPPTANYYKGPRVDEELDIGKVTVRLVGGELEAVHKFTLPMSDLKRALVVARKRQTSCLSNLKQSATAVNQYVQDYDEAFPMSVYFAFNASMQPCAFTMLAAIEPYVRNKQIYQCPSEPRALDIDTAFRNFNFVGGECGGFQYVSYAFNFAVFEDGYVPGLLNPVPPVRLPELQFPVETPMNYDGNLATQSNCNFNVFDSPVQARHLDFVNASFADGHAKVVKAQESGCQGLNLNGQPLRQWCITQAPYNRWCNSPSPATCKDELWGVAMQDQWGICYRGIR